MLVCHVQQEDVYSATGFWSPAGLSFAGVHDSFWTHAGSVETMNTILREKFLELHGQPLLENLRNELVQESPELEAEIPVVPPRGDLKLEQIVDAQYFFN